MIKFVKSDEKGNGRSEDQIIYSLETVKHDLSEVRDPGTDKEKSHTPKTIKTVLTVRSLALYTPLLPATNLSALQAREQNIWVI